MKELLLKYGITPELVSHSDMELFDRCISAAKKGDPSEFELFLDILKQKIATAEKTFQKVKLELESIATKAVELLESNSVSTDNSILSAFKATADDKIRTKKHEAMIVSISSLTPRLSALKTECAGLLNMGLDFPVAELKLREIAVIEYLNSDMREKYAEAVALSKENYQKLTEATVLKASELLSTLENELISLCINSDKTFRDTRAEADYHRVIRGSMGALHSLILNIKEL